MHPQKFSVDFKNGYWIVNDVYTNRVYGKFTDKKEAFEYCSDLNY